MRILHIISSLRTGGAERLVADLMPALAENGAQPEVLLFDGTRTPIYDDLDKAGIRIYSLSQGWKSMRNPFLLFPLRRFIRKGEYDIIHTHNTSCQLLTAIASIGLKVNLFTTEHNTTNRRRGWGWYQRVDKWMYSKYLGLVCVSDDVRQALCGYLPTVASKCSVIENGINLHRIADARPCEEIASCEGYKLLMVSAFRPQKDHPCLIRAMSLLGEGFKLFLAGGSETDEDRRYLSQCKALVEDMKLSDRVRFMGVRSDIPSLLAACDAVVLSSHYEGLPIAAIEAMSSGKPFVASDVRGLSDLVKGAGLLFPEGNELVLSEKIRYLQDNPDSALDIASRCGQRVMKYDISVTARKYIDFYACMASVLL